ncbi:MarC family protein [Dyella sedimenti]|uniref:MarC family protein n=1 Tax=Dyella sedimenti TaxID=2919947 RepID=UPI001FAAB5C2|nr:MarC family protein [Dyella sedimenti]
MISATVNALFLVMAGLIPVLNPLGAALIAQSLTPNLDDRERARLARVVALSSFAILVVSVLLGTYILTFFGITVDIMRIAGGCVIAFAGWRLLQAPDVEMQTAGASPALVETNAFYPITLPITVGPGSISVAIALGTDVPDTPSVAYFVGMGIALVLLALIVYACMRYVCRLRRMLGAAGGRIVDRLFAFILFCIGMQLCWRGISALIG